MPPPHVVGLTKGMEMNSNQKLWTKTSLTLFAVLALAGSMQAQADSTVMHLAMNNTATVDTAQKQKSLYARLGGYDAISAVVDDLVPRLAADPKLGRFWAHRGADGIQREKQLVVNFIVDRAGGPLFYSGRDMVSSHKGMKISEGDWRIFVAHLRATLEKFKVPEQEKLDVNGFVESLKATMVE